MNEIILSMQRKVIGGYINAAECATDQDRQNILNSKLEESWFDMPFHKAVVRAINLIKQSGKEVCDLNVLEFLQSKGLPRSLSEGQEYNELQSTFQITYKSFTNYIATIKRTKALKVAI